MSETKLRVVLYARVSTSTQAGDDKTSLDTQLAACRQLAQGQDWEVVGEFRDDSTGYSLDRPGMDVVRRLVREGGIDYVVAHKQERLSRSQEDTQTLYGECRRASVRIWTVMEGSFDNTPLGRHLAGTFAFLAEMDRANRREATMRGAREKVKAGKVLGSSPRAAYGYDFAYEERPNGKRVKVAYTINEAEAEVVRWVFEQTRQGRTPSQLAADLNDRGVPTPYANDERFSTHGLWSHSGVRKMLRNEVYTGEAWALVHKRKTPKGAIVVDKTDGVRLPEGVVPALVSREEFAQVQHVLDERHCRPTGFSAESDVWVRGGIAKCGLCGSNLILSQTKTHRPYLKCSRAGREADKCGKPSPTMNADKLEASVWSLMRSILLDPYVLYDRYTSPVQVQAEERALAGLRDQLAGVEKRRTRLLRSLEFLDDADVADVRERLVELSCERDTLKGRITQVERRIESRGAERSRIDRLVAWLQGEQRRIDDLSPQERRAAALELGITVRLFPTGAPERYIVEIGSEAGLEFPFAGLDYETMEEPTLEQRRETTILEREAAERGRGAGVIGSLMGGANSVDERYFNEYIRDAYLFREVL